MYSKNLPSLCGSLFCVMGLQMLRSVDISSCWRYSVVHLELFNMSSSVCILVLPRNSWLLPMGQTNSLGQCKARPFNFHQVCLFLSLFLYFFVSLFQCPNTEYFSTPLAMLKTSKKKKKTISTNLIRPWLSHWPILHAKFYIVYFYAQSWLLLLSHFSVSSRKFNLPAKTQPK